jgi:hypothetical protein
MKIKNYELNLGEIIFIVFNELGAFFGGIITANYFYTNCKCHGLLIGGLMILTASCFGIYMTVKNCRRPIMQKEASRDKIS